MLKSSPDLLCASEDEVSLHLVRPFFAIDGLERSHFVTAKNRFISPAFYNDLDYPTCPLLQSMPNRFPTRGICESM